MVIFHSIIHHSSFTKAAASLGVSVSYISKQLTQLEAYLGITLVTRTTRTLSLTDAGKQYFKYCEKVVEDIENAERMVADSRSKISGKVRIGMSQSFGNLHMIPAIKVLRKQYPNLEIELSLFDHKVDMVEEQLDLWVTNFEDIPQGYIAQRLADCKFLLVASPEYLIENGTPSHPNDLVQHNCLVYKSRNRHYSAWAFQDGDDGVMVNVDGDYCVDLAEAIRDAAVSGWGVAYLATYLIGNEFKQGKLVQLLPRWRTTQVMPFYIVYPSRRYLPFRVTTIIDFLKSYVGDPPYWDKNLQNWIK
ncbi:LysR family transcriptional regulator [Paraferrimonas sp. SM1919]|uniref:LysR family transcriptional regulator n=1 Tax=Paraferrimonas sp. SM1919 TaxID=2662263 RepID=UPI001969DA4B|nr:LysR family transcriptional regulator [Paraferrimonas sp. SM1919]